MATADDKTDTQLLRQKGNTDLQEILKTVGLDTEFWLPKLQKHLGVTSAQALQYLEKKDLQVLKSQVQHPWEKKALKKVFDLSHSNTHRQLQDSSVEMKNKRQRRTEQALQGLNDLFLEGRQREDEAVRRKEAELRQTIEIPEEFWPLHKEPLWHLMENVQRHLSLMQQTFLHRQNLSDKDLVKWASGGLSLQGIYQTGQQRDLVKRKEKLLSVPKEFTFSGPEQDTRMETREFTSSQAEAMFTESMEKLGFSLTASASGGGWGFSLEGGTDTSKDSESKESHISHSEHSYFCSTKFSYIPLASCHFPIDQLQFSKAALQELKHIEDVLDHATSPLLKQRIENFFHRFGSHANQGPLHLGGIYWWKAISEGFQRQQLEDVKQQAAEALNTYIRGSYSGFGVKFAASLTLSELHSQKATENKMPQNHQTNIKLSVCQTGGPPESEGLFQWKAGLEVNNQTWCVIDRGLQLVPVWDIILASHRSDFKDAPKLAKYMNDNYIALTGLSAQIQYGGEILSAEEEARVFLEDVKSWEVSDPKEQLKKLMNFMQSLCKKRTDYDIWINMCLTNFDLQNFLLNVVNFCKTSSISETKFIKSQLCTLLDPHAYKVENFPQTHSIMQWIYKSESKQEEVNISQFSELIKILKEALTDILGVKMKSESQETMEEVQRTVTHKVSLALTSFLKYLREVQEKDTELLLLCIAVGAGYHLVHNTFQHVLGSEELKFLLNEIQNSQNKYQELKNISIHRAHSFLVLICLTVSAGVTAVCTEEKTQRMALVREYMGQSLSQKVACVLNKPEARSHNWENLEKDLRLIIDGEYEGSRSYLQVDKIKEQFQILYDENRQIYKSHDKDNSKQQVIENGAFQDLLKRLGLEHHFSKRMSRADFHLLYKTPVYRTQPTTERELPFYFLQKLLMLDYGFRYLVYREEENMEHQVYSSASDEENEDSDPYEDSIGDSNIPISTKLKPHIHPMDIQMAIFHCADDFARQYILGKLSMCQFALPLLVPNPCTSQIEFSLWCLRQIRRSWQHSSKSPEGRYSFHNQQMCCVPTSIVSFIRVGNGLSASKSQIMNYLLNKRKHDVFFHRHCKGSSKDCLLMEGVVEICWFCPGAEDEDRFENCVTFANLHGDAKEHKQQFAFLKEVSSLIVILMSASDDNEENKEIVHDLWQSSKLPVICLLDDKEKKNVNPSGRKIKIGIRNRNEADLTEEITIAVRRLLGLTVASRSMEDCSHIARKQGFLIDEDHRECKEAKDKAEIIMTLLREMNISHIKEVVLPLQGELWHLWCKKDKELYDLREKGNRSIEQHKCEIEEEKEGIRHQQSQKALQPNDTMIYFLEILKQNSEIDTKLYFLHWLNIFLDNLTRGHLEKLQEKQRSLWSRVQAEKQKAQNSNSLDLLKNEITAISAKISQCTLGIEQFMREIGQMYEALEETSSKSDTVFLCLPQIAADLMLSGMPIELMDGDASYVPLKWVAAVFDKVSEKLPGKRLFVLSILGVQSSGKSTLLNALFGLQFCVSAGRCTRGAYMQLLKVDESFAGELGFDFLLVVDTEGLRAPELNSKSQNRDNELATFVIGLANLTLINIFGENPSEMQDILQIVVQAFLRMKQVKISPSCLFVHQNVGEATAKEQTMEGRRQLQQKLDEMAAMAAEQEQCTDVFCFNDVIKFDINTHVHYFAHLWDGNPPMAPLNPRYSHNVQELKSTILLIAKEESRGNMKISDVKFRVEDLWRALVSENFIFSFRNTREVMAMSKLECMYNQWSWKLRSFVLHLQNQLNNQIQNGKIQTLQRSSLEDPITQTYDIIKQDVEKYFNEGPESEIMIQWKGSFENKLLILKETLVSDAKKEANKLIDFKKSQQKLDEQKTTYEKEILKRSRELALSVKGKELSEEELQHKFNELWSKWVCDMASNVPPTIGPNIEVDSQNILLEHFKKEKQLVNKLKGIPQKEFGINYGIHIQISKKWYQWRNGLQVGDEELINGTTKHIFSRFNEAISNIWQQHRDYNVNDFYEILKIIEEEVSSAPTNQRFLFTSQYNLDLALHLFGKASKSFEDIHSAFKKENNPVHYLERKKEDFFTSFKISSQGATSIKSFVDFLWNKLIAAVTKTTQQNMAPKIAEDMQANCDAFNGNRSNLEKHILIYLAEKENFDNYWQYIHDPRSFFKVYIENYVKRHCSEEEKRIKTFLKINLNIIKNSILCAIQESTAQANDKSSTASEWLDLFCGHLEKSLIFPRADLQSIEHQEIKDMEFLKEAMSIALDSAIKKVEQNCSNMPTDENISEIQKILSKHFCGCWKQCPFCKAICTNTIPGHDGDHSAPFHRPKAVTGCCWHKTDEFSIDCCSTTVASDVKFLLNDTQWIPYKTYRQAGGQYASWSITPDSSSQLYWKWFVVHFQSKLEEKYQKKFKNRGKIPDAWAKITKEAVLNDLRK
ncbi:interferon-induced very large GTPase 1-like [Octodon degus]|uniref:Interferon-induced very large GTPase 1-like n=1 Tax=Octodon degus TaxID=10160 RepID=A0A6P3FLY0_OCTDE|nr:interferon-induced very large GTPase 1-like [Octodon degus]XP_023564178.1 interferon-induced very large GTPase 1-like [Octodon degus]